MDWMHDNVLRIAEVLEVHPESNSISVRFVDDGSRIPDVPVMSSSGSSRTGTVDLPVPEVPEDETHDATETERVYSLAVIAMTSTLPVCLGFVQPAVNELAFKDMPNLRVWRHASDAYSIVQDNADMELVHPGGARIRMGTESLDLAGKDYDKKWAIRRNVGPTALALINSPRLVQGCSVTLQPNADIDLDAGRSIMVTANETVHVEGGPLVHIKSAEEIILEAPIIRFRGTVVFEGGVANAPGNFSIAVAGNLSMSAGGTITQAAPSIVDNTPIHTTTGVHTDANGPHGGGAENE